MSDASSAAAKPLRRLSRICTQLEPILVLGPGDELVPAASSIQISHEEMKALRKKYDLERDKRLDARPEGNAQYQLVLNLARSDARFARMLEDPYPRIETPHPLFDQVEVCIIGAGFGGLCAGARLVQAGVPAKDIRIVDKAGDVGGTWYWNRYPGAMCDVESYIYLPLCEELGYIPKEKYARQPEIYAHSQRIARTYGLYENASFSAQVTNLEWNEATGLWTVRTDRDDAFRARFVIVNFGTFNHPKLPGAPGIGSFQGHMFHTSRWDYQYTGGDACGKLNQLGDKRVAIIGTGATAVQVIPHLAEGSKQLLVFQRTPSSVDIRNNRETTKEFAEEYLTKPGWQQERQENFYAMVQTLQGSHQDLVADGWTDIIRNLLLKSMELMQKRSEMQGKANSGDFMKEMTRAARLAQYQQMEKIRRRTDIVVKDPATASALKPWYDQFCKRPCFHDNYLDAFNRPNVTLVHTDGLGIESITPKGVVANGVEYEVDCIVMATGFEVGFTPAAQGPQRIGLDVIGRNGLRMSEKWSATTHRLGAGPKTFRSYHSAGFPNLFMMNGPQGAFTINFVYQLDQAAKHFAHIIQEVQNKGYRKLDVKEEAEEEYLDMLWAAGPISDGKRPMCTPGYYNNEGVVGPAGTKALAALFPGGSKQLFDLCEQERQEGKALEHFHLS